MLTDEESLLLAYLESILPWAMYCGDTVPAEQAPAFRAGIINDLMCKGWGSIPGDPTGPGGTFQVWDTAALPWLNAMVAVEAIRHRAPDVRR
jgi:hypothetical protein